MHPNAQEIEKVGNAFISIGYLDYTPQQQEYLIQFLRGYGQTFNENELKKIFNGNYEVIDAIKVLHDFSSHYQHEQEIYPEFRDEIEELIVTLNGKGDGNSIVM